MSALDRPIVNPSYGVFTTDGVIPAATQKTGTITSSGTVVTGTGTSFKTYTELRKGDYVWAEGQVRKVTAIFSDTRFDINRAFASDIVAPSDLYVIRSVPNTSVGISVSPTEGGTVEINTVDYDAQLLNIGTSIYFESMNGVGPIAYTIAGGIMEIANGKITK